MFARILKRLRRKRIKLAEVTTVSLGWVNVYNYRDTVRMSCIPKETKAKALAARSADPKSQYRGTVEIFARVDAMHHAERS